MVDERRLQGAYAVIDQANAPATIRRELMEQNQIDSRISRNIAINLSAMAVATTGFVIGQKEKVRQLYYQLRYS